MSNNNKVFLLFSILVVFTLGIIFIFSPNTNARTDLDDFTKCIKEKGAVFYGAFWCKFCQNQKNMFGTSKNIIPYQECSTPSGNTQVKECNDKNINTFPTWVFLDGTRLTGVVSLENLALKTGCTLPVKSD